jgi:hypothetical protein
VTAPDSSTLVGFTLQQGVAVAVCVTVAVVFAVAIVKLHSLAREERKEAMTALQAAGERGIVALDNARERGIAALDKVHAECRQERQDDRKEWLGALDEHRRTIERLADRMETPLRVVKGADS